ncbi:lipoprotein [Accumulibacter sp.]|uniref:LPS translocon maturation chaperone LptM n=1 Tax=Accumulibacter sp. TaxID=2053492 RepID=UPI00344CFE56
MWPSLLSALLATIVLGGCGNRGSLVLPPKVQTLPATVPGANQPAAPSVAAPATGADSESDSSTPGGAAR